MMYSLFIDHHPTVSVTNFDKYLHIYIWSPQWNRFPALSRLVLEDRLGCPKYWVPHNGYVLQIVEKCFVLFNLPNSINYRRKNYSNPLHFFVIATSAQNFAPILRPYSKFWVRIILTDKHIFSYIFWKYGLFQDSFFSIETIGCTVHCFLFPDSEMKEDLKMILSQEKTKWKRYKHPVRKL